MLNVKMNLTHNINDVQNLGSVNAAETLGN